mmetsp:Transcript_74219/g.240047  ORF Transcript_74219/g.240047 Transcript_74219/m.240047 type:complete len:125 (+) Transcript_74219:122-496(+)
MAPVPRAGPLCATRRPLSSLQRGRLCSSTCAQAVMECTFQPKLLPQRRSTSPRRSPQADMEVPVMLRFTAGHEALVRGSVNFTAQRNPLMTPVRGMRLIRRYGILMKRQAFREKVQQIGFIEYS